MNSGSPEPVTRTIMCAYCNRVQEWPRAFPVMHYAQCFDCLKPPPPSRARLFVRAMVARARVFAYQGFLMPEDLKDELANLFVAMMTALLVGSLILRLFYARH